MYSGVQDAAGTGTLNPALLNSAAANTSASIPTNTSPRGVKRSRSPSDTFSDLHNLDDGDGNSRKRGRPTKPLKGSSKVLESPTQSTMPHSSQAMPPHTPQQQNVALPPPVHIVTPSQTSPPPKSTPTKTVVKALPTVRDHTTDQLGPEGDEYIPREYDEAGEKKVTATGHLNDNREYKCRTFFVPNRGNKLFMLATECARVLGYRDSYLLFNKNRSLYKIIATQTEKEDLIQQEILPFSYRSRQIAIVTAKSMFRQFGSRVIVNGRRVRDDYWESKARKQGFTEADLAGEKRPGGAKARDAAAAEAANASAMLSHQGDIVYSTAPVHFGAHPQPQTVQPGMMGPPMGGTPLPMIVGPDQNDMRLGEYRNVSRPRQELSGPAYQDRTQPSPTTEVLTQSHHAADYNKQVNQQRKMRGEYIGEIWRQPHDLPASTVPPSTSISENLPPVTQSLQTTHQSGSNVQQPLLSNQSSQHMQAASYTQAPSQQASQTQTPMRNMSQSSIRPDQMHGRSPNIPLASTGLSQNAASYGFSPQTQTPMWAPAQPQQSPQHFSNYPTQASHQSPHLQHSTHQQPPHLRQSGSNPQIQPGIPYQSMGQGYPQSRGMYQPDQVPQQYLQQGAQAPQSAAQSWTPQQQQQQQHSAGQGSWGWGTQG